MKHTLSFALVLLFAAPAIAGTLTLQIAPGAGATCQTDTATRKCVVIPDADLDRITAAYKAACPQVDTGTKDSNGAPVLRACTNAETFAYLATGIFRGIAGNVVNHERENARRTSEGAVAPIGGIQ